MADATWRQTPLYLLGLWAPPPVPAPAGIPAFTTMLWFWGGGAQVESGQAIPPVVPTNAYFKPMIRGRRR